MHCLRRWAATLGIVLAVSRAFIAEAGVAFEPELALLEVVAHTHWLPRHWRGRAHTQGVQQQFQELFQFKVQPVSSRLHHFLTFHERETQVEYHQDILITSFFTRLLDM